MELNFLYWFLCLVWFLAAAYWGSQNPTGPVRLGAYGWSLVIFLLFLVIGYKLFGHPIK